MKRFGRSLGLPLLASVALLSACSPPVAPAGSAIGVWAASGQPTMSSSPTISATSSTAPSSSPSATPTPTARPTATVVPTPAPTAEPWKTYTSARFHYSMNYPPRWSVTPGTATILDQYDNFGYPTVYVDRQVGSGTLRAATDYEVAYLKSHYGAKLISNKAIKLAGFPGRLLTMDGKENGVLVRIVEVVLVKGRVAYYISQFGERALAASDVGTFQTMYESWRPR